MKIAQMFKWIKGKDLNEKKEYFNDMVIFASDIMMIPFNIKVLFHSQENLFTTIYNQRKLAWVKLFYNEKTIEKAIMHVSEKALREANDYKIRDLAFHEVAHVRWENVEDLDGNTNAGESDIFLMKFDKDGNKIWTKEIGTPTLYKICISIEVPERSSPETI